MAGQGIAKFGDKALGPLLDLLHDSDNLVRSSVLFTIRDLLEMHISVTPASQARIRDVIRLSLGDPDFGVRNSAISAVEYLDNREEFVPALQKLALSDPVKLPGKPDDGGDGGQFYPLRQHARKLLRKIANHKPPVLDRETAAEGYGVSYEPRMFRFLVCLRSTIEHCPPHNFECSGWNKKCNMDRTTEGI